MEAQTRHFYLETIWVFSNKYKWSFSLTLNQHPRFVLSPGRKEFSIGSEVTAITLDPDPKLM